MNDIAISGGRSEVSLGVRPDEHYVRGIAHLVGVVQELSLARTLEGVQTIVRSAARVLSGADGASFVLRDGRSCFYADEDAVEPLWKGKRFPIDTCVSGWAMNHRTSVVIDDIYADARVPHDLYRATFVKSLAMVPIRRADPIGAIGTYWAKPHSPDPSEMELLQALADSTSIAIENVQLYSSLEERVRHRTAELEAANRELESFSYSVSHDLRAPIRAIHGFARAVMEDSGETLNQSGREHLARVTQAAARMNDLVEALLDLARFNRVPIHRAAVDVTALGREIARDLAERDGSRVVRFVIHEGLRVEADAALLRVVLENLMSNAWKFTGKKVSATIEIGSEAGALFVKDDGAGFDMRRADRLFAPFQRLCSASEFPGTGIGLATVMRIVRRHGGVIRAESKPGMGAVFRFTLTPS